MDLPRDIGTRIGLLGGTFDPVHNGHLAIAAGAREQCRLDLVIFVPAANPPHKEQFAVTGLNHRLRMLDLACGSRAGFYVSSLEAQRRGPSYTVDTLHTLKRHFSPQTELFFIIGSDSFVDLPSWKEPGRLLHYANLVVVRRAPHDPASIEKVLALSFPGYVAGKTDKVYRREDGGCAIILIDMEPVPVSATEIRDRLRQGSEIGSLVPAEVASYIEAQGLYRERG